MFVYRSCQDLVTMREVMKSLLKPEGNIASINDAWYNNNNIVNMILHY